MNGSNVELAKRLAGIMRINEEKTRKLHELTSWDVGEYFDELYDLCDIIVDLLGVMPSETSRGMVLDYTRGHKDFDDLLLVLGEYNRLMRIM